MSRARNWGYLLPHRILAKAQISQELNTCQQCSWSWSSPRLGKARCRPVFQLPVYSFWPWIFWCPPNLAIYAWGHYSRGHLMELVCKSTGQLVSNNMAILNQYISFSSTVQLTKALKNDCKSPVVYKDSCTWIVILPNLSSMICCTHCQEPDTKETVCEVLLISYWVLNVDRTDISCILIGTNVKCTTEKIHFNRRV